jgi:multiple sugar transport system substrate-binding protein
MTLGSPPSGALRRRRILGGLAGGAAAAAVACQPSTAGPDAGAPSAAGPPSPTARERRIEFYVWGDKPEEEIWTQVVQAFQAASPGIKTDLQVLGSAFGAKLATAFAAGTPPDSFYSGGGVPFGSAKVEQLLPIDDYVKRDRIDPDAYFPVTLELYRHQGKLYSLPIECGAHVVYYNKEVFGRDGETTPDQLVAGGRWTWDQSIATARALSVPLSRSPDQYGYAIGRGTQLNAYAWSFGGGFVDKEREPTKSLWDQPVAQRALQHWADLRDKHGVRPTAEWMQTYGGTTGVATAMTTGKLAMAVQGAWERLFLKDVTFTYDIAVLPKGDRPATEGYSSACVGTAASKEPEATWQWVKFTGGEEGQKIYAGLISVPPLRRVAESEWFLSKPPVTNKVYLDAINTARSPIGFPEVSRYNEIVSPLLAQVDGGQLGVAEACHQIHTQLSQVVFGAR